MALIVEDGTGLANAESYASVATANAYHTAMGNAAWTGVDAVKEAALRRATQYLDTRYRYRGLPLTQTQALAWPRSYTLSASLGYEWSQQFNDWPPSRLVDACCELALRALTGALYADQEAGRVKAETVGPISVTYAEQANGGQVRYAIVDDLLGPLVAGGRSSMRVERA